MADPTDRAAADSMREVHSILAASGVPAKAVFVRGYRPVGRLACQHQDQLLASCIATAGPCGLWPHDLGSPTDSGYIENRNYWNLGCATQRNLAAMVDNPADLVQPRGEAPAYTARRTVAIDKYRKGESPAALIRAIPATAMTTADQRRRQMIKHAQQVAVAEHEPGPRRRPNRDRGAYRAGAARLGAGLLRDGGDRRRRPGGRRGPPLVKAHVKIQMGGVTAAVEAYRSSPTPNVIMLESDNRPDDILAGLDPLAEVCDAGTRVIVVGRINDVTLYRELMRRGVSDYLIAPVGTLDVVRAICGLYSQPDAKPVGRVIAVVGAKGGVGASTVAHNIAWAIARDLALDSVVADLDLAFGTAGLDYNQDPPQGIADAVFSPDRIDTAFVDRLLSKCTDHLSLLAAPATLERVYDFGAEAFDSILDSLRATMPCVVLDVPHQWTGWTKRLLVSADDILIVAAPDLANLRNAKNMVDLLRTARPNDHRPFYCLNQVGVPKRPEITPADFAKALEDQPLAVIPFDPQMFGTAANNGQMIAEVSASHKTAEMFRQLAQVLTGRAEVKRSRGGLLSAVAGQADETAKLTNWLKSCLE